MRPPSPYRFSHALAIIAFWLGEGHTSQPARFSAVRAYVLASAADGDAHSNIGIDDFDHVESLDLLAGLQRCTCRASSSATNY